MKFALRDLLWLLVLPALLAGEPPGDNCRQTCCCVMVADRQLALLETTILPRARQVVALMRTAYQNNAASLLDLLDSQRSLIDIERLVANLRVTRDKRLADIETITTANL